MSRPRVLGIDLSLTSTGLSDGATWVDTIKPKSTGLERMRVIRDTIRCHTKGCELAVVEGLAYTAHDTNLERAGLWWMIRERLDAWDIPTVVITPSQLKKYVTGNGSSHKDKVLAAVVRRWPDVDVTGNDESDALVLAAMALDQAGHPTGVVPDTNVLAGVRWPEWWGTM